MVRLNRRTLLGITSVSVGLPFVGYYGLVEDTSSDNGYEEKGTSEEKDGTVALGGSGSLRIQNTAETPQYVSLLIKRRDTDNDDTLIHLNTTVEPSATISAEELVSTPDQYYLEVETESDETVDKWEVKEDSVPPNIIVRLQPTGEINLLRLVPT